LTLISAIERLASFFILSWGWRRAFLALGAGALSALAMPPFDLFFIMFITLPALVWLMDATATDPVSGPLRKMRAGFVTGWWFGFGYFTAGLWWIGHAFLIEAEEFALLMPAAVLGLPAVLAVFTGAGTAVSRLLWRDGFRRIAALAIGLGLGEYARGVLLTGFPWNSIGMAAMTTPLTMQKIALFGLNGVTVLAVVVFAAPALVAPRTGQRGGSILAFLVALAALDLGFGAWRLAEHPQSSVEGVSVRIVQPAINQAEKWSPEMEARHFKTLMDLSVTATSPEKPGLSGSTIVVWPETAFPFLLTERRDALAALGAMIPEGTTMIAGAVRIEPPAAGQTKERAFNSAYTIDANGEISGAADKVHLVPFGEYLPFQETLESLGFQQLTRLRGGFESGSGRKLLDAGAAGKFLPLICYEIIFPGDVRGISERPDFIVNLTNDAWFGRTPGPYQHWRQAVLRGVETGLPVVRAANSGLSSVSDASGRITGSIALEVRGVIDTTLPVAYPATFAFQFGNLPFFVLIGVLLAVCAVPVRQSSIRQH
jgi:apolipoprotein N-acyltransferase